MSHWAVIVLLGLSVVTLAKATRTTDDAVTSSNRSSPIKYIKSTPVNQNEESLRGYPCVRRLNQLYCPSPGKNYPSDLFQKPQTTYNKTISIFHTELFAEDLLSMTHDNDNDVEEEVEEVIRRKREEMEDKGHRVIRREKRDMIDIYIDENKSLVKRMFGEYTPPSDHSDSPETDNYSTYDGTPLNKKHKRIKKRDMSNVNFFNDASRVDTCESIVEIVTPYWASNSAGKIRAIVNTQHLQQAIQQEVCQSVQTKRCKEDCSCEQKYKWHRLLAYDPDDDCRGIFMDWFLFPSCCVCRCSNPLPHG